MRIKANNIKEEVTTGTDVELAVEQKLNEVAALLNGHQLDEEKMKYFQDKFSSTLQNCSAGIEAIDAFKIIDEREDASREELLNEFSTLLLSNKVDSRVAGKYIKAKRIKNLVLIAIALTMITLGLAMIVIPAPPYFELFTIYYFTPNDGITLMDVISCIIILIGIYLLVRTLYNEPLSSNTNE
ncbi:hypothetical protein [Mucilaginibacter auburnensis]|uniref:Uncharacterized protein n=1 Tax=Mucilaginibacter auburnensis TaxID=1457233 RepID=A0A2H9VW01_9SPHI|nr:hypothetical protein [Mucilaginibacter auburnensis]PJJ84962.1 hypothetical protein CLV57_1984 [Mucilaginibacter auburnensis]